MKITDVITESFAYDYAEPWGIFEPEDFIAKIKELVTDDSNFIDVFLFATDGLKEEWPELHEEVCAILKPYALRYLLKIAKGVNVPEGWDPGDFFNHWVEEEFGNNLKPDWPELQHISDVANRAFAHGKKTESVNESEESDELVAEFLGYLDHHNYWEAFNSLIGAYDTNADCLQVWHSDVQAVKSEVIKGLLHVIKHEPDLQVDAIIADMYADLKWPELLTIQKAMQHNKQPVAEESDADPMIGYIQDMYSDLKSGFAGMTVLQLRDYIYDTGSAENLANSIKQIQPELPALINQHKTDIVKNMLEIIKKDFEYAVKAVLPVLEVLHHLGIHWPESDRIAVALTQGKKQIGESAELIPAAEILKYVKQIHPEGEFNIDYVITDHPFWQEADVPVSSLHIFDPEKDDIYDPYNRVQDTNLHHVDRLIPNIAAMLQNKPLVIDDAGYILDGNHRALAAEKAGLQTVPVWQPVKGQKGVAESVSENTDDLLEFQLDELAAWHGSFLPRIGKFKPFSHFGSEQAARERLEWMAANDTRFKGQHTGFLYRLDLGITAPAKVKDYPNLQDISTGSVAKIEKWCNDIANDPRAKAYREDIKEQVRLDQKTQQPVYRIKTYSGSHLLKVFGYNTIWGHWHEWGVTNQQRIAQFVTLLKKMGIDGLVYKNQVEHKGELSYIAFDASSVRVIGRAKPVDLSKFVTRVKKPGIKVKPKFSKFIKDPTTKPNAVTVTDLYHVAESNVFTNARMNAIKAGKDTFVVHGKTYKVTGDTTDERQAEITEDITATDIARYVQFTDKKLSDNLRNLFLWVIELNSERRMSDPEFRSQVLAVFDKRKPEILHYMLRYIKHSDADNIKWLTPAMIKMGIDWPELKTINQALNAKKPDRAVTENNYRFSDVHQQKAEEAASHMNSSLERLGKHIAAGGKISVREITSFWDVIYDINVFSKYRLAILQPVLEHHKKTIVYMMLYILKHHDMDEPMDEVFTSLRHARINWPELKTIQQALAQGSKTKSVSEADDYGKFKTISGMIARDFAEHPVRGFYMMLYHLNELELSVADMPEIKPMVDKVKPDVIRALLLSIKHDDQGVNISNALRILDRMQNCGVNWPEIDKIRQGLQHGRNTESVTEASDDNTFELLQKKLATIGRKFNKYDEDKEEWISNGFPTIKGVVFNLHNDHTDISFLLFEYNIKSVSEYSRAVDFKPKAFLRLPKKTLETYADPRGVIHVLLHILKRHSNNTILMKQMQKDVNKLKSKYDWPELDVILKALNYQLGQGKPAVATEARDASLDPLSPWVFAFKNHIQTKLYWHIAITLEELAMHLNDGSFRVTADQWAQAAEQLGLDAYKDIIIKSILENLRDNIHSGNSTDWLQRSISTQRIILQKLGCNWPEMDRIAAAVGH